MSTPSGLTIPQSDPRASYRESAAEILAAVQGVLDGGRYILGSEVTRFEKEFARYIGVNHGIGVASGTDALLLALKAVGVGEGDAVVTVSHTVSATLSAIRQAGATPVLVDIDPDTYVLDPQRLADTLRGLARSRRPLSLKRVRAVVPVHLYGHCADLSAIASICREHNIALIEDCAQAHGAEYSNRRAGSFGDLAAFSFYPTKNLGAIGDGGAVVTKQAKLADAVRSLREYGWKRRYVSEVNGYNSRLDEVQAAVLRIKLRRLDAGNSRRRAIASRYQKQLQGAGLLLPFVADDCKHVYHQYVVRTPGRDQLKLKLQRKGIGTLIHYPVPTHLQPAFRGQILIGSGGLSQTERVAREVLSLPVFPQLSDDQVGRVSQSVRHIMKSGPSGSSVTA